VRRVDGFAEAVVGRGLLFEKTRRGLFFGSGRGSRGGLELRGEFRAEFFRLRLAAVRRRPPVSVALRRATREAGKASGLSAGD